MNEDLMKSLRKQLTAKERLILADLWESDVRGVLTKLWGLRQLQLAQFVLKSSADHYWTVENRGRANELMEQVKFLSDNLSRSNKEREASKSNM